MEKRSIKGIRCDLGFNQTQMAEKLNISVPTYQRYETGKSKIPFEIVVAICKFANIENPLIIKI